MRVESTDLDRPASSAILILDPSPGSSASISTLLFRHRTPTPTHTALALNTETCGRCSYLTPRSTTLNRPLQRSSTLPSASALVLAVSLAAVVST
ncbi:hypothetical protein DL98DRAFT_43111 [Cadophora sp. DSE1049]|nr:hypothetical protein DL98DRAFT_43111 [Cadophora sp. DSE1049]